jgi:hypothetical protein
VGFEEVESAEASDPAPGVTEAPAASEPTSTAARSQPQAPRETGGALADEGDGALAERDPAASTGAAATVAVPEPERVYVPAGTHIPAVMEAGLSTRTSQVGDVFHARVTEEILAEDGMVLVPEGARLEGRVAESRPSESSDEEALLLLTFEALLIDGGRVPLDAVVTEAQVESSAQASGARSAATVGTGAAAGAIVGRILGGDTRSTVQGAVVGAVAGTGVALVTRDGNAAIQEGSRVVIRLESPALLR